MSVSRTIIVTLSDACLDDLASKVTELKQAGFEPTDVLEALGQVVGDWSEPQVDRLLAIPGVLSAEESGEVSTSDSSTDLW